MSIEDLGDQLDPYDGSDMCPRCRGDGTIEVVLSTGEPADLECPKCQGSG